MDQDCKDRILSEDYADFMIRNGSSLDDIKARLDICYDFINYDNVNVYTPVASVPKNFIHLYGYSAYPNCYGLMDIASVEASGIYRVRNIPNLNLRGHGILIGVVDTGIEYTHSAFRHADGTSRIVSIWDQTIQSDSMPEGFPFGTEYTQEQINAALASDDPLSIVPSTDEDGHGTFLAGIAAGSASEENNFTGVVPDAELIAVKLKPAKNNLKEFWRIPQNVTCYQKNDLMYGIRYLVETASKLMRPLSLFIGVGTSQGAHDERGALSSYLSALAAQSGIAVVIAGGNEGNRGHHYYGAVKSGSEFDTVELKVGPNEEGFTMEIWGIGPSTFSVDILSPTGEYIPRIPARIAETREIRFIFEKTIINLDYQVVESQSGDELILMRFKLPTEGIWRFRVYSSGNLTVNYHVWLPIQQFITNQTYFVRPDPEYTLTSPGNTDIPIVVTAYDHTNQSLYINSGRGYIRNENIAPSLAAPGVNLIGPGLNNTYITASGTSAAAAHTAGITAMLLEWGILKGNYTHFSTIEIKNLLLRGAKRDPNMTYPNKEWGYGIIDLYNTYESLRSENV